MIEDFLPPEEQTPIQEERFVPVFFKEERDKVDVWVIGDSKRRLKGSPLYGSLARAQRDCGFLNQGRRDLWGENLRYLDEEETIDPIQQALRNAKGY